MINPKSKILPRYHYAFCARQAVFTLILNNRLYDYVVQKGILKAEQGGFRKMHGTVNSIFILLLSLGCINAVVPSAGAVETGDKDRAILQLHT